MRIIGIDPGPTTSGVVIYEPGRRSVVEAHAKMGFSDVLLFIGANCRYHHGTIVAIEAIEALYAHVGKETVRTIHLTGRMHQHALRSGSRVVLMSPQKVKKIVCGTASAKDPAVRQALLDQVGPQGRKADPGPTYGVKSHAWRALAVAVAASIEMVEGIEK